MKRLMVVVLATVAALLVGPMSIAYAGGMGLGNNVAWQCYVISGDGPGGTIDLFDRFGTRENFKIGGAKLFCTDVNSGVGSFTGARNPLQPQPCASNGSGACDLKCYDVRSSKASNPAESVSVSDFFFGHGSSGGEDLTPVGAPSFVCLGAEGNTVQP